MSHVISIELDVKIAKRLLETIGHEVEDPDKMELCNAIEAALSNYDMENI